MQGTEISNATYTQMLNCSATTALNPENEESSWIKRKNEGLLMAFTVQWSKATADLEDIASSGTAVFH